MKLGIVFIGKIRQLLIVRVFSKPLGVQITSIPNQKTKQKIKIINKTYKNKKNNINIILEIKIKVS